jgi:serine/threonine protein kinase
MAPRDGTDPALLKTPAPEESDGEELIGHVIDGRYRLDATLGRGGMGLVFRATHLGLRRQVAVKILHPSLMNASDVKSRFEREALAVGRVDHPNCVSTYDVGRLADGSLYLAMELLEGKSLADILEEEGQLAPGRALHILAHILRGLGSIHAAGLVHRDIKPENIFLIRQGDDLDFAKILDFGIAKPIHGELSDDNVRLTQAGMAFGTPIYMAPEQALGAPMDGRADLYAAAVIGYEMLCGQPPFYSEDKLEVMSMHTAKPVPPMRNRLIKRGKPVPSSLEKLVLRGLTKKADDRYASAEVFLAAVESALATADGGQTSVEIMERPARTTGSQSLIDADGEFALDDNSHSITNAIEEALAVAPVAETPTGLTRVTSAKQVTPAGGSAPSMAGSVTGAPASAHLHATHPHAAHAAHPGQRDARPSQAPPFGGIPQPPLVAPGQTRGRPPAQGGVGLGLPYTGPQGEPIFGLTPDQRLAQVPPVAARRKLVLYGAIAAAAIVIGVVIAIITRPAGDDGDRGLDPSTPAGAASEALERGDFNGAIQLLEADKDKLASDAKGLLVLGHAYAARNDAGEAITAYRAGMTLEPALGDDKKLRANLRTWAGDKKAEDVIAAALDLWVTTSDPEAKLALEKAVESPFIARRHAAITVLDRHKLGDDLDRIKAYSLDLQDQPTCPARAEAVAKLRAIGDPRAIPALQRAILAKGKSKEYRNKPINGCLIDDAKAAIGYLESMKK